MKSKKPNIVLNYVYNLFYQLLAVLVPLVTMPYLSRVLRVDAIGVYSYSNSIVTYFSLVGILGLNIYGQLQISKVRENEQERSSTFFGIFLSKAFTSFLVIIIFSIFLLVFFENKLLYLVLSMLLFSNIFDISWFYQGLEDFKKIAIRNIVVKLISVVMIFTFVKKPDDLIIYALILNGSTVIANLTLWLGLKKHLSLFNKEKMFVFKHIKSSLVFFIPTIASSVYTILDKSMLGWIANSDYENGVYEQAHKIELTAMTIVSSLSTVLLPRMTFLFSEKKEDEYKRLLQKAMHGFGVIAFPIMFGLIAISDVFIPVFLGEGFEKCIILLRIFSVLVFFSGANVLLGNQCLVAQGKQKYYNIGVVAGALTNLTLNLALIPFFLSIGAAIASVAAEISIFVIFMIFSRSYISLSYLIKKWWKSFLSGIIMFFIVFITAFFVKPNILAIFVMIAEGAVAYFVCLLMLRDSFLIDSLKRLFKKSKREINVNEKISENEHDVSQTEKAHLKADD